MMDPHDFDRDVHAWLDGELPPEAAARMQAAADASPELAERAALHRALDARIRGALSAEPAAAATVAAMAARARAGAPSIVRRPWYLRRRVAAVAATLLVAGTVMWAFCIGPFECRYLIALEAAADDPAGQPGPAAEELMRRAGLPTRVGDALAQEPPVALAVDFINLHTNGLRVDYWRPDGSYFRVTLSECCTHRPSANRKIERDGREWWTTEYDGHRLVAFDRPQCSFVYCVVGPAGSDRVFAEAAALRDAIQ